MTGDDDKDRDDKRFERTVERLLQTPPKPKPKRQAELPNEEKPDDRRQPRRSRNDRG